MKVKDDLIFYIPKWVWASILMDRTNPKHRKEFKELLKDPKYHKVNKGSFKGM